MELEIVRFDDNLRGIGYLDGKIVFVPKAVPGDVIIVSIVEDKKNYSVAKIVSFVKESKDRVKSICPYFEKCGGCSALNITYDKYNEYKLSILENKLVRSNLNSKVLYNAVDVNLNYRNKISLKIVDKKIGFFEESSNKLVEISYCNIASNIINKYIEEIHNLNIINGNITLRSNYKNEVLIVINSVDKINVDLINKEDVIGIVVNNKTMYGVNYFIDKINGIDYEIMYDSFFQVNPFITAKILTSIKKELSSNDIILDLYSGVGTISLNITSKVKKVYGIEVNKNAVINSKNNKLINNIENVEFFNGDLSKKIKYLEDVNVFIIDPPRSGIDKIVMNKILELKPSKIIYMSCNPNTLIRDLKILSELYSYNYISAYDMFSYTYHLETVTILDLKESKEK